VTCIPRNSKRLHRSDYDLATGTGVPARCAPLYIESVQNQGILHRCAEREESQSLPARPHFRTPLFIGVPAALPGIRFRARYEPRSCQILRGRNGLAGRLGPPGIARKQRRCWTPITQTKSATFYPRRNPVANEISTSFPQGAVEPDCGRASASTAGGWMTTTLP